MNRRTLSRLTIILLLLLCASAGRAEPGPARGPAQPALTQIGVIDALLAGGYEGSMSIGDFRRLGDIGLGTFDALDGELVLLDGVVYQVPASGHAVRPADSLSTPFAQAARMPSPKAVALSPGMDLKALEAALDAEIGDANVFAAARVDGRFARLSARSVPRQAPPYRPLSEVAKEQTLFSFSDVEGTLVGLRGPAFAKGLGVTGWHWHFITSDRDRGGHVLSLGLGAALNAKAQLQTLRRLELILPEHGLSRHDLGRDRSSELHAVESGK